MAYKGFALPRMRQRTFWILMACLLAVCAGAGLGLRASATGYAKDPASLAAIAFEAMPSSDAVLEEVATGDLEGMSSLVVVGRFTGQRTYVYQALKSEVEIEGVVRGIGPGVGETIWLYEPYAIGEPGALRAESGGYFSDGRVLRSTADCLAWGTPPMRKDQSYLLFLNEKAYPTELEGSLPMQTYLLAESSYSRIPTDVDNVASRVEVIQMDELDTIQRSWGTELVLPSMPLYEAEKYDQFVQSEEGARAYEETCRKILRDELG